MEVIPTMLSCLHNHRIIICQHIIIYYIIIVYMGGDNTEGDYEESETRGVKEVTINPNQLNTSTLACLLYPSPCL